MLMSFIFFSFEQELGFSVLGSVPLEAGKDQTASHYFEKTNVENESRRR